MLPLFVTRAVHRLFGRGAPSPSLHAKTTGGAVAVLALAMAVGSYAVVAVERDSPVSRLTSYPRALWWSAETATTVGYGDLYPVTLWGRIIACLLMLVGITTWGVITAAVATWFVGRNRQKHYLAAVADHARQGDERLREEARALHERFDRLERAIGTAPPGAARPENGNGNGNGNGSPPDTPAS